MLGALSSLESLSCKENDVYELCFDGTVRLAKTSCMYYSLIHDEQRSVRGDLTQQVEESTNTCVREHLDVSHDVCMCASTFDHTLNHKCRHQSSIYMKVDITPNMAASSNTRASEIVCLQMKLLCK
jgi:hypothetical protein